MVRIMIMKNCCALSIFKCYSVIKLGRRTQIEILCNCCCCWRNFVSFVANTFAASDANFEVNELVIITEEINRYCMIMWLFNDNINMKEDSDVSNNNFDGSEDKDTANAAQEVFVIGTGLPRTGTLSTAKALSTLLNCDPDQIYHGMNISKNTPDQLAFWPRAYNGEVTDEDWRHFFQDYRGCLDLPAILFYQDLMRVFPNAKIILTLRDPDSWYHSWHNTIALSLQLVENIPYKWFIHHDEKVRSRRYSDATPSTALENSYVDSYDFCCFKKSIFRVDLIYDHVCFATCRSRESIKVLETTNPRGVK
jgi:hypothetical protein